MSKQPDDVGDTVEVRVRGATRFRPMSIFMLVVIIPWYCGGCSGAFAELVTEVLSVFLFQAGLRVANFKRGISECFKRDPGFVFK